MPSAKTDPSRPKPSSKPTAPAPKPAAPPTPKPGTKAAPQPVSTKDAQSKKRASKLAPAKSPRDVKVKVDGKLKKQWDQTLGEIRKAKGRGAEAFDELWEAVARVVEHDPPLYVIGGYGSAAEFFEEVLQEKARTARRFMRVAKYASPREETKYGTTLLDAALAYIEATAGGELSGPLPIAFERLRIPVVRGAETVRLPLEEVTAEEITKATRALASKKNGKPRSSDPVEEQLRKALIGSTATKAVRATVRGGVVTFSGVPVDSLPAFAKLLAGLKLPAPAPGAPKARGAKTPS